MRFIKLFLKYLILALVVVPALTFLVINILVYTQAISLADDISSAKKLSVRPTHVKDCISTQENDFKKVPLLGYQLRFLDNKEYVVEAVCTTEKGPVEVKTGSLKYGVYKIPGFSGILFPLDRQNKVDGKVVVGMFFSKWLVRVGENANMEITLARNIESISPGENSASATCGGWGYMCCNYLTEVGKGDVYSSNITDCAGKCYDSCLMRPSILIFTSDPEMKDQKNRILEVDKNDSLVVFSYSVDDIDSDELETRIDFGDGESLVSNNQTDQFSHTYSCQDSLCIYKAELSVKDSDDLDNTRSRISTITIRVK